MNVITTLEESVLKQYRNNWLVHLLVEKHLIQQQFDWLSLVVKGKMLVGSGVLHVDESEYEIQIQYSPFFKFKMDSIQVTNHKIKYNDDIHVYGDLSLCLYHPVVDKPALGIVPLHKMIPWISEWCHFYGEWKKYGVWLGREIKHTKLSL